MLQVTVLILGLTTTYLCYFLCILSGAFNDYVRLTGCTRSKRPLTVGDDTPLIHLLSHSVDGEQGSDLLYTVIVDIVSVCTQGRF